jgi:hypothetical protein
LRSVEKKKGQKMVQESLDLQHTSMDDVFLVEVVNRFKDLSDGL